MIDKLLNQVRQQVQMVLSNVAFSRMGTITAYDQTNYTAQVTLEPVDTDNPNASTTGFLPILSQWLGNGWGMFAPPIAGAACMVHFSEANSNAGVISLMNFNESFLPQSVPSGEFWLVHESGSYIKLTNDGNISISANATNLGLISAGNLQNLLLKSASDVFNSHTHASNGAPPTQQMTAADWTQYTEAN